MWLKSHSASFSIGAASLKPYALFHYSDQASCIVTTTNFLAVYKAVNQIIQNKEWRKGGGAGVELGGLQGSRPDVMKEGGKRMEGGEEALVGSHLKTVSIINIF